MAKDFVERRHGSFYLIGSRVHDFQNGETPEAIQSNFPTLSLEEVYGAITFYLGNKEEVEKDLAQRGRVEDELIKTQPTSPELKQKLERAREQLLSRQS